MSQLPQLTDQLTQVLPADAVSHDPVDLERYGKDWTRVYKPAPIAVALPRTTQEVVHVVNTCRNLGIPIVPSGGRTGLAAGAVAAHGELVLSLERMRALGAIDEAGDTLEVQAGAVTEAVHRHCVPYGLTWPVDFASKGSSQVGGNIATNAGGVKVLRYGVTRQWVLGLEVVLADGRVLRLNGALEKNNTGLDLRQMFIGSEGILGIITGATLKLTRIPQALTVMMVTLPSLAAVLRLFRAARRSPFLLTAYEFFTLACLRRLQKHRNLAAPFANPSEYYVLMEVEESDVGRVETWLGTLFEADMVTDGVVAQTSAQALALWALREGISESLSATGTPHKNDVALPISKLEGFCDELDAVVAARYPGYEICNFGHIGDGNLHINIMKPEHLSAPEFFNQAKQADHDIFRLVQKHAGSISAEHGIGLLKKDYLSYSRTPEEISLLRAIKKTLDPTGLFNPGKVI